MSRYTLDWSFGLRAASGKYLTAETFQYKIAATGGIMKKKQIFFLEQPDGAAHVCIRSHLGKYLSVDGDGNFTGNGEEGSDENNFLIEAQPDGRWLLKSAKYGWYAGGTGEALTAFTTEAAEDRHWTVHLAMHPMICLRNVKRKTYAHLADSGVEMNTDEVIPWGHDATLQIQFNNGTYKLQASNGKYLTTTGMLGDGGGTESDFIIEFAGGDISFKSAHNGKYVTALGASGLMKASKTSITKDEQWTMEDSYAQVTLRAKNSKYVSIKAGIELAATATEITDREIFQLEPRGDGKWIIKTCNDKLWALDASSVQSGGASAAADEAADESCFEVEFNGPYVNIKGGNGKYVSQQMNSYLKASGEDGGDESTQFVFEIINRPKMVFRGMYGFVGTLPSKLLECNKSTPEQYGMTVENGRVALQHANGEYWKVSDAGVACNGGTAEWYTVQLHKESKLTLMGEDGKYFVGAQNGALTVTGAAATPAALWEY